MARRPRAFGIGEWYHVGTRGNNREPIVRDDIDRVEFLRWYTRIAHRERWRALAYVLMDNHYHFVVRCAEAGFSAGMQLLNCGFARRMNRRHGRTNHIFKQRFYAKWIQTDEHLLEACRYVVLNPVRAGLCERPEEWRWSSYRATVGLEHGPEFLDISTLLGLFASTPEAARHAYRDFVAAGHGQVSDTVPEV